MISFVFEPLQRSHFPLLLRWLKEPHVKKFWDPGVLWTEALIEAKYSSYVTRYKLQDGVKKPIYPFIIFRLGKPIGYIQYYDVTDFPREGYDLDLFIKELPPKLAAIDIFLGEGVGIGSFLIRQFLLEKVWSQFDACLVDPDKTNLAAIGCYQKAGFIFFKEIGENRMMIAFQ